MSTFAILRWNFSWREILILSPFLLLSFFGCGCAPVPTLFGVPRLDIVDAERNVWRSAQPENAAEWATLKGLGIKRDVVLRKPEEWPSDPHDALAAAAGIQVIEIPMPPANAIEVFEGPSEMDTERAVSALELGDAVVHCLHGQDRTGWVSARYHAEVLDWSRAAAWNDALRHGLHIELFGLVKVAEDWLHAGER